MPSPMMKQYRELSAQLPAGTILIFRLGDFYEVFLEDAARVAKTLGIRLTKRMDVPMAGFPYHHLTEATKKLVEAGFSIAIAEMTHGPQPARAITQTSNPKGE